MSAVDAMHQLLAAAESFAVEQSVPDPFLGPEIDPWQANANRLRSAALAYADALRENGGGDA